MSMARWDCEWLDMDLAYPDAEAPAEIMQRAGLNEEYELRASILGCSVMSINTPEAND
jgi:hypothetical protein